MANRSLADQIWWQLAIFIIVSSLAALVGTHFKEKFSRYVPETLPNASALNKKPSGSSGLYELCKAVGLKSHLWKLPYRDLKDVRGQLLIISPKQSLQDYEIETILKWVENGNDLVYLDQLSTPYSKGILARLSLASRGADAQTNTVAQAQPDLIVTRFVNHPKVSYITAFRPSSIYVPIVQCGEDTVLIEVRHGLGRILIGSTANLVANSRLAESGDNFQLVANWLRFNDSTVYFDERCHGLTQSKNLITTFLSGTSGIFFLQLMLILAIAIAGSAQRFGQRLTAGNPRKISNLEFVHGIANSYKRARATHLAADVLSHNLRLKLAKALGQSTGDDETLVTTYIDSLETTEDKAKESDEEKSRLIKTLARSKNTPTTPITSQELAEISAYCDKIQETIEKKRQAKA